MLSDKMDFESISIDVAEIEVLRKEANQLEIELRELKYELSEQSNESEKLRSYTSSMDKENALIREQNIQKDQEIRSLKLENKRKDQKIATLVEKEMELSLRCMRLASQLAERDSQIIALSHRFESSEIRSERRN